MSSSHDDFRPPSYEPYRPSHPRSIFPYCSDDESYLTSTPINHRSVSFNNTTRIKSSFPDLSIANGGGNYGKSLYPTSKKSLVPILKTERNSSKSKRQTMEKIMPNYHNLIFSNSEEELNMLKPTSRSPISIRSGSTSPKYSSSHHGLCTNPVLS